MRQRSSGDLVIRAEEPGRRVLPSGDEASDNAVEPRVPRVALWPAAQDQADEAGGGEVQLLAAVDAVLDEARDKEAVEIARQTLGIVDPVEKSRRMGGAGEVVGEQWSTEASSLRNHTSVPAPKLPSWSGRRPLGGSGEAARARIRSSAAPAAGASPVYCSRHSNSPIAWRRNEVSPPVASSRSSRASSARISGSAARSSAAIAGKYAAIVSWGRHPAGGGRRPAAARAPPRMPVRPQPRRSPWPTYRPIASAN